MKKSVLAVLLVVAFAASMLIGCSKSSEGEAGVTGSVYYLNFKPEADVAWQDLAATYTEQTGVEVKVVTPAFGEYENILSTEMGTDAVPTIFSVGDQSALETWKDYTLDLTGTDLYKEVVNDDFNIKGEDGKVYAIGYYYDSFGIIVNKALLKEAGYDVSDIINFDTLKKVAEDITARKDELGFSAFSSAGLDGSSSWRFTEQLANMPLFYEFRDDNVTAQPAEVTGAYLDNFKNIWDLYINNATCNAKDLDAKTGDDSEAEFGKGEAVFFQNGSWEYANLCLDKSKGFLMNAEDLTMIPLYCGVEGEEEAGLCNGTEDFWAVNSQASEADIQATLDFLTWVVTSDEGTAMLAEQFGGVPFKDAKGASNPFCEAANQYIADGKYTVSRAVNYTPNADVWRLGVESSLLKYSSNSGSWDDVVKAYVQGWATQYTVQ